MRKLHAYSHYGDVSSRPTTDLAERIPAIAPMEDAAVFFTSGGGESIETVVKLVRRYWSLLDQPDRTVIISRERAYHGLAGYGTSIVGTEAFKVGVGPLAGDTARVAWDSAEALEATIVELGPERVAAFFCEPIIGAGGVLLPPDGLSAGGARDLPRPRRAVRRRRGDLRLRPRRRLVRLQPRRARARRGHVRQGDHLRLRAARRRHRRPHDPGAVLGHARGRRLAARLHVLGPRHALPPLRTRTSTSSSARDSSHAGSSSRPRLPTRSRRSPATSSSREIRVGLRRGRRDPDRPCAARRRPRPDRPRHAPAREHGVLTRTLTGGGLQISPPLVITRAELDEIAVRHRGALDDVARG